MLNAIRNVKKKALIVTGASVALVLGCAGVVWVDHGKIEEEKSLSADLDTQIAKADARIRKIKEIEDRVLKGRQVVKEYAKILPNDKEINDFVAQVTTFASASHVLIEELNDTDARTRSKRQSKDPFQKINYKIKLRGNLDSFLEFVHRFESYERFVKIAQFKISTDDSGKPGAVEGPVQHKVELELETYVYEPSRATAAVDIPNADKRTFEILEKEPITSGLSLDTYSFMPRSDRRDPFANPRHPAGGGDQTSPVADEDAEKKRQRFEELAKQLDVIKKAVNEGANIQQFVARIEFDKRVNASMVEFGQAIEEIRKTSYFARTEFEQRFDDEVAGPFDLLFKARRESAGGEMVHQELEAEFQRMERAFTEGRFNDVVARAQSVGEAKASNLTDPEIQKLLESIRAISDRAKARLEFAQLSLAITGFVFQPARPERAVVIINDRAYSPGDVLDDGVVVGSIDPARVVFFYKREEIARALD